ncbi:MAG: peptide ABC transporter substrate-binding protein [Chloroflexia bacterium]|nr:peptide ABC transporter substrate-binding protein [Chloroflexia bacterium]
MANRDPRAEVEALVRAAQSGSLPRREVLKRAAAIGLGASSLAALVATYPRGEVVAALRRQDVELAEEQVVRLPEGEPVRFDPGVTSGGKGLEMLQNLFEGLVGIDQRTGELEMLLAETMTPNADATEFTFTVRDGLLWSDGTPLTARDFEYSWKRVLLPETKSEYTTAMYPVAGAQAFVEGSGTIEDVAVRAVDDKTLTVGLSGPIPYFPLLAATWTYYPVPRHVVEEHGDAWVEAGTMVSNGPYMLTEWNHDQNMVLEQNPNYWGQKPTISRGEFTLLADNVAQALVPFENDELDQAQVSGADLDRAQADDTLKELLQVFPRSGTRFVVCDVTNPPTDNPLVRQALSMAIDRATLADGVLKSEFTAADVVLPPDIPGYNPESGLGEDVARAKELLAEAGFADGAGFPQLTLTYGAQDAVEKTSCEYLQGVWQQNLGIDVRLEAMEDKAFQDWFNARATEPFSLYISFWGSDWGDPANWHNQLFESSADFYHMHWVNERFDQLVNEARGMADAAQRLALYEEAEAILNQDSPVIPLHNLNRIYVIKPYVKGIYHYPILGRTWLKYIQIEQH